MQHPFHTATAVINLGHIRHNYRALKEFSLQVPKIPQQAKLVTKSGSQRLFTWQNTIPVIKADAYGHGQNEVADALMQEGAEIFATGTVAEAVDLRRHLDSRNFGDAEPVIVALLGLIHKEDAALAYEHRIIPVLHNLEQFSMCSPQKHKFPIAVKCDTGMGRLGFLPENTKTMVEALKKAEHLNPVLAISHLSSAGSNHGELEVESQAKPMAEMLAALRAVWPDIAVSLCNSAGTLLCSHANLLGPHICRLGYSLYGGNPFFGTTHANAGQTFLPAMQVKTALMSVKTLPAGAGIGYDKTCVLPKSTKVGVIAVGYADFFTRSFSNKGEVMINGSRATILGRVSMQMTAVDLSSIENPKPGDDVWLLGGPSTQGLTMDELATAWGTIPYEILCLLGCNSRQYI